MQCVAHGERRSWIQSGKQKMGVSLQLNLFETALKNEYFILQRYMARLYLESHFLGMNSGIWKAEIVEITVSFWIHPGSNLKPFFRFAYF